MRQLRFDEICSVGYAIGGTAIVMNASVNALMFSVGDVFRKTTTDQGIQGCLPENVKETLGGFKASI